MSSTVERVAEGVLKVLVTVAQTNLLPDKATTLIQLVDDIYDPVKKGIEQLLTDDWPVVVETPKIERDDQRSP